MPKSYTTCKLRGLLGSANRKFAHLITKDPDVSEKYIKISKTYQQIISIVQQDKTQSTIRELYKLKAQLGFIKCQLNSINLSPTEETILKENDSQLQVLEEELNSLTAEAIEFKVKLLENNKRLLKEYAAFLVQLKNYKRSWRSYCNDIQAAYYYNCAVNLETPSDTESSITLHKKNIKQAILLFEKAATLYEKNGKTKEKRETDWKISKTKSNLAKTKQKPCIELANNKISIENQASSTSNDLQLSDTNFILISSPLNKEKNH